MEELKELDTMYVYEQYDDYLKKHIKGVNDAFLWLCENIPELVTDNYKKIKELVLNHDKSKYCLEEYDAYAQYFYGDNKTSETVKENFDKAWLHHQHFNPHHWNHWVLINDEDGTYPLDMPYEYIVEMVCDHLSFSFNKGNLNEIFSWYDKNKYKMILSENTRKTYEDILNKIKEVINK